ncbi:hypothetical protein [Arcanobacterium hippocoleae]
MEGRVAALRGGAPVIANIKDHVLRAQYALRLAGWLGLEVETVQSEVQTLIQDGLRQMPQITAQLSEGIKNEGLTPANPVLRELGEITDPVERIEHSVLQIMLQFPGMANLANAGELTGQVFTTPIYRSVHDAIMIVGGIPAFNQHYAGLIEQGVNEAQAQERAQKWFLAQILMQAFEPVRSAVVQLSVEPIRENRPDYLWAYVRGVMMALIRQGLVRQIVEVRTDLNRLPETDPRRDELFAILMQLEERRRMFSEADS